MCCHTTEYGCGPRGHHAPRMASHHPWGCHAPGCQPRHYPTKEETISQLEEYVKNLQAEAKGVEERIAELKKEQT